MIYELYYKTCWNKLAKTPNAKRFYYLHDGVKYVVRKEVGPCNMQYLIISPYTTCLIDVPTIGDYNALLVNVMTRYAYRKQGYGRKLLDFVYHLMLLEKQYVTIEWDSSLEGMYLYKKLPYAVRFGNTHKFKMNILNK